MKGWAAVYRRELYSYYTTPQGYVFTGLFVLTLNLFFYFANVRGRASSLGAAFAFMLTVLMLTVPLLTMRMFAGEYRRGTDRLLLTAPAALTGIVMGKLLAAMTVFAGALSCTLIWAEIVALFGGLNTAEYIGNIIAIIIFAAVYVSLGLMVSALTSSQAAAAAGTLGLFGALFLADVAVGSAPDSAVTRFLSSFSLFGRYDAFSRGVFSVTDIAFCVTACAVFVFLTAAILGRRRHGLKGRWKHFLALAVPVVILLVAANMLTSALENRYYLKVDLTRGKVFTLTEPTVNILNALPEPVTVTVLSAPGELAGLVYDDATGAGYQLSDLREALEKYKSAGAANGNLTFQYIDPELNPAWLQARDLTQRAGYYSLIVESGRRVRVLSLRDLYETQTLYDYDGSPVMEMTVGLKAESAITSAILNVVTERLPSAAVIQGHAEYVLELFEELLRVSNFSVNYVNLSAPPGAGGLTPDTALVVLAGPQFDLSEQELNVLDAYMSGGGHMMVALDPSIPPMPNLEQYLTEWGARFGNSFVCDGDMNYGDPKYLLTVAGDTHLTELPAVRNRYLLIAGARPITALWEVDGSRLATPLFSSFGTAYAKPLDAGGALTTAEREDGDAPGPFILGMACEQMRSNGEVNYAFMLPLSALSDAALIMPNFLNRQLISHWMSLIQPGLILDIMPRDTTDVPLALDSREVSVLFWLLAVFMPLTVFGIGGGVWLRRRKL